MSEMRKNQTKDAVMHEAEDDTARMPLSRKFLVGFISLLIFVFFWILMVAIIRLNAEPEDRERTNTSLAVQVDTAKSETVQLKVNVQGEARPGIEIDLVPEVGGKIVYVSPNFIDGGIFRKGETLIRIEDADYNANVVRAQSAVAQAEQVLVREVAESEIARRDYEELGTGTPSPLALREPQRAQAEAALSAAKAELATANLQLGRTSVRAPFSGRVRSKDADIGQYVNPGARLARIFSTNITEVRLALSDSDLSKLDIPVAFVAQSRESAPEVILSATVAGERRIWNGKIMRTDSSYDTQTRALFAIAEVYDPYGEGASQGGFPLAPGLFVDAEITGKIFENVITFKRDGLRSGNEVYIIDNEGNGTIHTVTVLDANAQRAVVSSGVTEGQYVVLSPMEKSRISTPLKAIDVNDPTITLVTPKPRGPVSDDAEKDDAPKGFWAKLFPEEEIDPDALTGAQKGELISVLSSQYAAFLRDINDEQSDEFRKLTDKEKGDYVIKLMSEKASQQANNKGAQSGMGGR